VLLNLLLITLAGASGWLWWKLFCAQLLNTQLQAELSKLRLRLRSLR